VIQKFLSLFALMSMSLWVSTANAIFTFSNVTYTANSVTFTIDGDMSGYGPGPVPGFGVEGSIFTLAYGGDIWTGYLAAGTNVVGSVSRPIFDNMNSGPGFTGSSSLTSILYPPPPYLADATVSNAPVTISFPSNIEILDVAASAPVIYFYWGDGRTDGESNALSTLLETVTPTPDVFTVLLEEPVNGEYHTGIGNLRGWAISPDGIDRVEIYIDGKYVYNAPYGGSRLDVAEAYPKVDGSEYSGYSLAYGYSNLGNGEHTIMARAVDLNGDFVEDTSTFTVVGFDETFIFSNEIVDVSDSTISAAGDEIFLEDVTVGEKVYDLKLKWRTAEQGFEIIEIR
jgi:hypothetical protein